MQFILSRNTKLERRSSELRTPRDPHLSRSRVSSRSPLYLSLPEISSENPVPSQENDNQDQLDCELELDLQLERANTNERKRAASDNIEKSCSNQLPGPRQSEINRTEAGREASAANPTPIRSVAGGP